MKRAFLLVLMLLVVTSLFTTAQVSNKQSVENVSDAPRSNFFDAKQLLNDIKTLSSDEMQGRLVGTSGGIKARQHVLKRFRESGLKPFNDSYLQPFEFAGRNGEKFSGANVVGYIKGRNKPEKYIVVTAHYDHLGVRNDEIYNGADDNASGTAALFALSEYFDKNRPSHSIIFAALDAEEGSGAGGLKLVSELLAQKRNVVMNVNLDMISHSDVNELYAVGTYHYPFLKPYLEIIAKNARVKLLFGHEGPSVPPSEDWTSQSDHYAFHQAKIPFVYFGVEDHKDYHKPTDDFANINQSFYVRAVETIFTALKAFDTNATQIEKQKSELK